MRRFYWIVEESLAGCSRPGGHGDLATDLESLRRFGIAALLSLTESPLDTWALDNAGIESLHIPVQDMTAPQPVHFAEALGFIDAQHALQRAVAVHCLEGQGRTGSILAAWLIRRGATAEDALAAIRNRCPGAVENADQEEALELFERTRPWII